MAVKVDEALRAHVRSTLPEAPAGVSAVVRTPRDGGERKPVTGDAEVERRADDAEGGECGADAQSDMAFK